MNHLPECGYTPEQLGFGGINSGIDSTQPFISGHPCICDRLRACEQRVLTDLVPNLHLAEMQGYNRALTAAREAVVALKPRLKVEKYKGGYDCCGCSTPYDLMEDALTAIDALKETNAASK